MGSLILSPPHASSTVMDIPYTAQCVHPMYESLNIGMPCLTQAQADICAYAHWSSSEEGSRYLLAQQLALEPSAHTRGVNTIYFLDCEDDYSAFTVIIFSGFKGMCIGTFTNLLCFKQPYAAGQPIAPDIKLLKQLQASKTRLPGCEKFMLPPLVCLLIQDMLFGNYMAQSSCWVPRSIPIRFRHHIYQRHWHLPYRILCLHLMPLILHDLTQPKENCSLKKRHPYPCPWCCRCNMSVHESDRLWPLDMPLLRAC